MTQQDGRSASACGVGAAPLGRRSFMLLTGTGVAIVALASLPGHALAQMAGREVKLARYPRRLVGRLSRLETGKPVRFAYPYEQTPCMLVKLGVVAGAGIGPQDDVVAFTTTCTHMGGSLEGTYKPDLQILGSCPMHLTTFDLTRHGMVISGHATESLPQVMLETEGDNIYAAGVMGLIYGYGSNLKRDV